MFANRKAAAWSMRQHSKFNFCPFRRCHVTYRQFDFIGRVLFICWCRNQQR